LANREVRTSRLVAERLRALGFDEVRTNVARHGVVALLKGAKPGAVVAVRADMDALPINEVHEVPYKSTAPGVMHACGHDGHVAIGLTVARILSEQREQLKGTIKFVFQPAEEGGGGAERMVEAGVLENPHVDTTLAMHVWNERPVGWVGVTPGPLMAGGDIFDVRIEGKGGHGALPMAAVDPIVAAAQIISALQSIVSRNISPLDTAVVSVCKLRAGDAFNVIPQYAEMSGTLRTFDPAVRQKVIERLETLVSGVATSMGCQAQIHVQRLTPAVINDPAVAAKVRESLKELPDLQVETGFRTMVSEDMAYMMEKAPGCYIMVGSANAEKGLDYGHHHPKFDFDEAVLPNAVMVMVSAALAVLGS
jgi:amidohydrolase